MPDIGERTLELAKDALAEQERHVADMRTRGAPVLAAGGLVAGLLGKEAFAGSHPDSALEWASVVVALAAAAGLVGCAVGLFTLRRLAFSMNARATYAWLFSTGITTQPLVDLELADRLVETHEENDEVVKKLRRMLYGALACFVLLIAAFGVAAALAS